MKKKKRRHLLVLLGFVYVGQLDVLAVPSMWKLISTTELDCNSEFTNRTQVV
jgi:hypothetical protein